jgi:hypothetical protein
MQNQWITPSEMVMNRSLKSVNKVEDITESIVSMESNDIQEEENPYAT